MATDATGTPTSPDSIPTYNTAGDPPSGKGFNAAMAAIQTALSKRLNIGTLWTAAGDLAYASGAGAAARLGIGSAGQVLTVAGGVPVWAAPSTGPTVTTSLWSGGPPGSPANGDEWVAQAVDTGVAATGTVSWRFKWDSTAAKWMFIGGGPYYKEATGLSVNCPTSTWTAITAVRFTSPRAGKFVAQGQARWTLNANVTSNNLVYASINSGAGIAPFNQYGTWATLGFGFSSMANVGVTVGVGGTVDMCLDPNNVAITADGASLIVTPDYIT